MDFKEINPFTNIPEFQDDQTRDIVNRVMANMQTLNNFRTISAGEGETVFRASSEGIWMGGRTFTEAKWKSDMRGNQTWYDGNTARMYIGEAI